MEEVIAENFQHGERSQLKPREFPGTNPRTKTDKVNKR